jgi:hypothetical protein
LTLAWAGIGAGLVLPAAAAPPEAPTVQLLHSSPAIHLTDAHTLYRDPQSGTGELRSGEARTFVGVGDRVEFAGSTVGITTRTEDGTFVRLLDRTGRTTWSARLPADSHTMAFADAVALIPSNDHEPGMPYSLRIRWAVGEEALSEPERTVVDLTALEHHLAIASIGSETKAIRVDVLDARAERTWRFESDSAQRPRIAVHGDRAAAIVPGHAASELQLSTEATKSPRRTWIAGWMTDVAFLVDGSSVVAWGPHHVALIGVESLDTSWVITLPGEGRQLANDTSRIAVVGGTLAALTRRQRGDARWEVDAHFIDATTGRIIDRRRLFDAADMPNTVRRFPHEQAERLVFDHHLIELSPPTPPDEP